MRLRLLAASTICLSALAAAAAAQTQRNEPRLPPPAVDPPPTEALIQRARHLFSTAGYSESADAWTSVAGSEPSLAEFAKREAIRAQLAAGDLQAALTGLSRLEGAPPSDLVLQAANGARSAGTLDRAITLYRQARQLAGRTAIADEAALGLAATLEQAAKPRDALVTLRELQLTFRQASAYDAAVERGKRLSAELGDPEPLTEQDYDAIVDRLAGVAAFRRAVDVLTEWRERFPASLRRDDIDAAIVQYLYSLRANDESRGHAEDFLKRNPDSPRARSVHITLFRLDVREGRTPEVERRGRAIANGQIANTTLDDRQSAARLLAEYLVSVGQPARALGVYDQLFQMTRARGERIDVLWRMAIASLRAGNAARAVKELRQALSLNPDSETERAATYWLAYAQHTSGAPEAANKLWAGLAQRQPFSFYGGRAATRIGSSPPEATLTFPELTLTDAVMAHADYRAAATLSRAGLLSDAAVYARRLSAAFRRDDAVALLAARASEAAGDHTSSATIMSSYFGEYLQRPANGLPSDFWSLAYPRAYWADVSAAGNRHDVDPLLMMGLARQESHFNRTARSPVGAIGLFQIMPYTAVELDPSLATPAAMERLLEAATSAELAARLLAGLLARYRSLAPAVASYNADKERVQVWWDAARGLPEELFIDSIPYRETRAYVRQVLANYAMYLRYAQSPSPRK